jgi:hypothetical protein
MSAAKKYDGAIEQPGPFTASIEAMWQQGMGTLIKVFSYNVAKMIMSLQDCLCNPRRFESVKDLDSNNP